MDSLSSSSTWSRGPRFSASGTAVPGPGHYAVSASPAPLGPGTVRLRKTISTASLPIKIFPPSAAVTRSRAVALAAAAPQRQPLVLMRPRSTFGSGRETPDAWGRGSPPPGDPGPGWYELRANNDIFPDEEVALKSIDRRLGRLQALERRHKKRMLTLEEKIVFKLESRPATVQRLRRKRSELAARRSGTGIGTALNPAALQPSMLPSSWTTEAASPEGFKGMLLSDFLASGTEEPESEPKRLSFSPQKAPSSELRALPKPTFW